MRYRPVTYFLLQRTQEIRNRAIPHRAALLRISCFRGRRLYDGTGASSQWRNYRWFLIRLSVLLIKQADNISAGVTEGVRTDSITARSGSLFQLSVFCKFRSKNSICNFIYIGIQMVIN